MPTIVCVTINKGPSREELLAARRYSSNGEHSNEVIFYGDVDTPARATEDSPGNEYALPVRIFRVEPNKDCEESFLVRGQITISRIAQSIDFNYDTSQQAGELTFNTYI